MKVSVTCLQTSADQLVHAIKVGTEDELGAFLCELLKALNTDRKHESTNILFQTAQRLGQTAMLRTLSTQGIEAAAMQPSAIGVVIGIILGALLKQNGGIDLDSLGVKEENEMFYCVECQVPTFNPGAHVGHTLT